MAQSKNPISDVAVDPAWSIVGTGGATHFSNQDENVDNDYSAVVTANKLLELELADMDDPGDSGLHQVKFRARRRGAASPVPFARLTLMQGATTIKQFNGQALNGTFTTHLKTLTSGEASAITDYNDLRIVEEKTGGSGSNQVNITKVWMLLGDAPLASASFTTDVTSGDAPLGVTFTNTSDDGGSPLDTLLTDWTYLWTFTAVSGGPAPSNSTDTHPSITFTNAGVYTVALAVTAPGGNDTETKLSHITVDLVVAPGATNLNLGVPTVTLDVPVDIQANAVDLALGVPTVTLDVPVDISANAVNLALGVPAVTLDVPVDIQATAVALLLGVPVATIDVGTAAIIAAFAAEVYGLGPDAVQAEGAWPAGADF